MLWLKNMILPTLLTLFLLRRAESTSIWRKRPLVAKFFVYFWNQIDLVMMFPHVYFYRCCYNFSQLLLGCTYFWGGINKLKLRECFLYAILNDNTNFCGRCNSSKAFTILFLLVRKQVYESADWICRFASLGLLQFLYLDVRKLVPGLLYMWQWRVTIPPCLAWSPTLFCHPHKKIRKAKQQQIENQGVIILMYQLVFNTHPCKGANLLSIFGKDVF